MKISLILGVFALLGLVNFAAVQTIPIGSSAPPTVAMQNMVQAGDLKAVVTERDQLVADNAQNNEHLEGITAENAALVAESAALSIENAALAAESSALTTENAALAAQNSELATQNSELTATLSTLQAELENQVTTSGAADRVIAELNETIATGLQEQAALQARSMELENTVAEYETQIAALEAARTAQGDPAANAERLAAAQDQIAVLTRTVAEYESAALAIADEKAQLTAELGNLNSEITAQNDQIATLQAASFSPAASLSEQCTQLTDSTLGGRSITFETGTAAFDENSMPILEELLMVATACAVDNMVLNIEGHTGNDGGVASNLLLSNARAIAVQDFFEESGVPASSLRSVGFGGNDPLPGASPKQNQRIVFDWMQR